MIVGIDVDYQGDTANIAAVVFENWETTESSATYRVQLSPIAEYEPGSFYKRELPCLLKILETIQEPWNCVVVDGYVWLGEEGKAGLGAYLYQALEEKVPVIGVAKTFFKVKETLVAEVLRGKSERPLYVTTAGIPLETAAKSLQSMSGEYRNPTLLKEVDQLSRRWED